jgi:hypothetical protein
LLLVVIGLYQDCMHRQMCQYLSTFSQWPRFENVSRKHLPLSLSLFPFGMQLNKKAIRNVDYNGHAKGEAKLPQFVSI